MGKKSNLVLAVSVIGLIGLLLPNQTSEHAPSLTATGAPATTSPEATNPADKSVEATPSVAATQSPKPTPTETEAPVNDPNSLEELISQLVVAAEQGQGYDRDLFRHWIDADGDGCDTRKEVLIAEANVNPKVSGDCSLSGGQWYSVYDQVTTTDPSDFDVDHFVPLKEAWDSGAYAWTSHKRTEFANDLDFGGSLIAVTSPSNRSKSDRDPADWLPANTDYHCPYITNWVKVKIRWGLTVDPAELATIESKAAACR